MRIPKKEILITISYSYLLYALLSNDAASGFVFLFGITIELTFLIGSYVLIPLIRKDEFFPKKSVNIIIGAIPLLILNYFFAFRIAASVDGIIVSDLHNVIDVYAPLLHFKEVLLVLVTCLVIAYGVEIFSFVKSNKSIKLIEQSIIYHGIVLWFTSMAGYFALYFLAEDYLIGVITIMWLTRIIVEWVMYRKIKNKEL